MTNRERLLAPLATMTNEELAEWLRSCNVQGQAEAAGMTVAEWLAADAVVIKMPSYTTVLERVKNLVQMAGIQKRAIGRAVDRTDAAVNLWLTGKNVMPLSAFLPLCQLLGVEPAEILKPEEETDDRSEPSDIDPASR